MDCLAKVKPEDAAPKAPAKSVELFAGRNEFEPFQIVLRAEERDLPGVDIDFSDFRGSGGAEISKDNISVYLERFLNLKRPSSAEGGTGLWPDPLVPRNRSIRARAAQCFSFTVSRGRDQPLWIEVFIPASARPGKYLGTATCRRAARFSFRCVSI